LTDNLTRLYDLEAVYHVSFDVAVNVELRHPSAHETLVLPRDPLTEAFGGRASQVHIYRQAFSNQTVHCQASQPPSFVRNRCLHPTLHDLQHRLHVPPDVVGAHKFQAYSTYKSVVRPQESHLTVIRGDTTAVVSLPEVGHQVSAVLVRRQEKAFAAIVGTDQDRHQVDWAHCRQPPQEAPIADQEHPDPRDKARERRAFQREQIRLQRAERIGKRGVRFEQRFSVKAKLLPRELRSFTVFLMPIFHYIELFERWPITWTPLICRSTHHLRLLQAFIHFFEIIQLGFLKRWTMRDPQTPLPLSIREGVALVDRLAHYALTGDPRVLVSRILSFLDTYEHIRHHGWPYINPQRLDLRHPEHMDVERWPRDPNGELYLAHLAALQYRYGTAVKELVRFQIQQMHFVNHHPIHSQSQLEEWLACFFTTFYQNEMVRRIARLTREHLSRVAKEVGSGALDAQRRLRRHLDQARGVVDEWQAHDRPFSMAAYGRLCTIYELGARHPDWDPTLDTTSAVEQITLSDLVDLILAQVPRPISSPGLRLQGQSHPLWPIGSAWPVILREMLQRAQGLIGGTEQQHVLLHQNLSRAIWQSSFEVFPGYRSTAKQFQVKRRFQIITRSRVSDLHPWEIPPPPPRRLSWLDRLPFRRVPGLVKQAFQVYQNSLRGDSAVRGHLATVEMLIHDRIASPQIQMAFIHAIILRQCTKRFTAKFDNHSRQFEWEEVVNSPNQKVQSREQPIAIFVTRVVWFLCLDKFLPSTLKDMNQHFEHWKTNLGILIRLGYIRRSIPHQKRPSPRLDELVCVSDADITGTYTRLVKDLRRSPETALGILFQRAGDTEEQVQNWVDRFDDLWHYTPEDEAFAD
jgi:hypothetical protein